MHRRYAGPFDVEDADWTLAAEEFIVREREGQLEIAFTLSGFIPEYGNLSVQGAAPRTSEELYEPPNALQISYAEFPQNPRDIVKLRLRIDEASDGCCYVDGLWFERGEDWEFERWEFSGCLEPC